MGRGTKVGNCMDALWKPGASNLHLSAQLEAISTGRRRDKSEIPARSGRITCDNRTLTPRAGLLEPGSFLRAAFAHD